MDGFVHLHVHSHYSLLDGGNRIEDLVSQAKDFGMGHLALTDHGNLFGSLEFYQAAVDEGLRPILGMEAYISPTTRQDRSMGNPSTASYHLLLLAMNQTGWHNLMKLSSRAYLEGFYYKPRVDRQLLAELGEGLICTSACLGGEIPSALLAGQMQQARKIAGEYKDIFGPERFFIEVQKQGIADQDRVNPLLVRLAEELGVGIVGTNDVHFLRRQDKAAHEALTCISTGKTLAESDRLEYPPELYFKSAEEMRAALKDLPGAADNTLKIAQMCDLKLDFKKKHLPVFPVPAGQTDDQYLSEMAWKGLGERFSGEPPEDYRKRLEWELKVIADKGFSSYFLIVYDFVQYARRNKIPAGPRGSGVGTLLGYALAISDVDPLRYGLLFERFTDPQRKEAPDMDIDICQEGRGRVIQYVREKYGHVAQIITYGTLKSRAVLRDVGRVMGIPLADVDAIAKMVPEALDMTLPKALEAEPELRQLHESDARVRQLIDTGITLEGLNRHAGVHAAGVIVADEPLENIVPLCKQADSDDAITQWDGPTCETAGLMKMDFLGLRTLTVIQRARDLVRARTGQDLDPEKLPLDDPAVYDIFRKGQTDGVFQFESDGMKNVLVQMQPSRIEDLIAANAMYRPGPMELIPTYCHRKAGLETVPSVHTLVDDILAETYGIMVYQEQVMQVLNRLGKLPLNRALTLIKAISKKKEKSIAEERPNFIAGALANGIRDEEAQQLFDLILKFAGYGFNKSHSTRYAIIAYQTAFFKAHYPREFFAALLTFDSSDTDKIVQYMTEAKRFGITIAPPDINTCDADFTVDGEAVRFGLAAVKGVGEKAVLAILEGRIEVKTFRDLYDFCQHVDLRAVNRATIEALIKCGAFDSLGASRAAMMAALDHAIGQGQSAADDRRSGQMSFFGAGSFVQEQAAPRFPDVEPWTEAELLKAEKETLGFYITSHPLTHYARELASLSWPANITITNLQDQPAGMRLTIGCMIASVRPTFTKKDNRRMAMLTVEDVTNKCDAVIFPDGYEKFAEMLKPESMVFLAGSVDRRRETPSIVIDDVIAMDQALEQLTGSILLRLPGGGCSPEFLARLGETLSRHRGGCPILLEVRPVSRSDVQVTIRPDRQWFVTPTRKLVDDLTAIMTDEKRIRLLPKAPSQNGNGRNGHGNGRRPFGNGSGGAGNGPKGLSGPASAAVTRFN